MDLFDFGEFVEEEITAVDINMDFEDDHQSFDPIKHSMDMKLLHVQQVNEWYRRNVEEGHESHSVRHYETMGNTVICECFCGETIVIQSAENFPGKETSDAS